VRGRKRRAAVGTANDTGFAAGFNVGLNADPGTAAG
jgi:hypothetical protein